jgi:DNA replication protein DnaC
MKSIGELLNQDLLQAQDSGKRSNFVSSKEALGKGLRCKTQPPEPKSCEFCGSPLYHEGLIFPGSGEVAFWSPVPKRCTCPKAVKYWGDYEAEQKRVKEEEELAKKRAAVQERIDKLLGKSGIKKRFLTRTFENYKTTTFEQKKAFSVARKYADNFQYYYERGEGLYIEGTNGTGKTHLAAAIALKLIQQGVPVVCKTSIELLDDIKKAFDNTQISEYEVLKVYKQVDLLIIDDLGKEQCTDWSMSTLYSILNDRYEDMKPTIITTNFNEDTLIKNLTPKGYDNTKVVAIISRLREVSTVITMAWEDYRGGGHE